MFRAMNDIATGNTLLTTAQRKQMIQGNLGWDSAVRSDCPDPNVCRNGSLIDGSGHRVWTYAGMLKCDVPVVVTVNSPLPSPFETGSDNIGLVNSPEQVLSTGVDPKLLLNLGDVPSRADGELEEPDFYLISLFARLR
jgi:hypothetical protein